MTTALIDADIVAFRCAASAENEEKDIAILRADKLMRDIIEATGATTYVASLTGADNFRKIINPEYKANRKDKEPPRWLNDIQHFLMSEWKAEPTYGFEADDMLGMLQSHKLIIPVLQDQGGFGQQEEQTIICSIDKDLLQIPGRHYNFVKQEFYEVSELEGLQSFYKSALVGDTADNIFGVKGIGKVKAAKLIDPLTTEKDMYNTVCALYNDPDRLEMNLNCLWLWRAENELWSDRFAL